MIFSFIKNVLVPILQFFFQRSFPKFWLFLLLLPQRVRTVALISALVTPATVCLFSTYPNFWCYESLATAATFLFLLAGVALFTLSERKLLSGVQRRSGPNSTGVLGLFQAVADGVKLVLKEVTIPARANSFVFVYSPVFTFALSLTSWSSIPLANASAGADPTLSALLVLSITSLSVYGVIGAGWASNSRYALLGATRSIAQFISYEVSLGFVVIGVALLSNSLNLVNIVEAQSGLGSVFGVWFIGPLLPLALLFLLSILAETNRAPFDLPEAEAEIVAGYNVEYSGILFALFFLAEYANMLLMSALFVIFFLAGWASPSWMFLAPGFYFALKIGFVSVFYILVRAALPRVRYDQLMCIGWKRLLPLALGHLLASSSFLFCDEGLWRLEFDQLEHRSVAYSSVFTPF